MKLLDRIKYAPKKAQRIVDHKWGLRKQHEELLQTASAGSAALVGRVGLVAGWLMVLFISIGLLSISITGLLISI